MIQAPIDELDVAPGHVLEWRLRAPGTDEPGIPRARGAIASYNQEKHYAVAKEAAAGSAERFGSYVAGTFEIDGALDRPALESALLHLVRRHEVLRSEFEQLAGDLTCDPVECDDIALELVDVGRVDTPDALRSYLHGLFTAMDTLAWPLFVVGAVVRQESTTVFFGYDHLVCDGLSTPIAINDIATAYAAYREGRRPVLPEAGSYLAFSREERARNRAMDATDSRLDYWKGFMARNGDFFPRFPLDLGVEQGRMYPTVNELDKLLTAEQTDALETRCRAAGGRLFMGLLAAMGVCLRQEGGPGVYRGIMPISERGRGSYGNAIGWFVNTMPIEFSVEEGLDLPEILANVRNAMAALMAHVDVPFVRAWHLLAPEYATLLSWPFAVNFFSYLDFRRTPGAGNHLAWKARKHIWASHSNGICYWFHRNDTGLYVCSVYADTPQARRTKAALGRRMEQTLTTLAESGSFRPARTGDGAARGPEIPAQARGAAADGPRGAGPVTGPAAVSGWPGRPAGVSSGRAGAS
ncbi:condensation domain-containing protein [Streptantibioticus silvisoli]|uniref:Condensation domain-containing protein n=1 Tax=Streptantibioticus silvisoli TaxID=2705255 RepID=A0ABT6W4C4_9ACTN|nr:condensation domain-containing protein [Streptantibioticus silvisoli]MDI5965610.1 condensation domain-containing protein [Streptantibioticus silvisoli]